ncbi:DUF7560 family zinc ribbon protein [Haloferax larsenii]
MREIDVTCPECGERFRVNQQMLQTLRKTGCVLCQAPISEGMKQA